MSTSGGSTIEAFVIWLKPEDRESGDWKDDPTRPFLIRAGHYLRFGIGGWWGCAAVEVQRP